MSTPADAVRALRRRVHELEDEVERLGEAWAADRTDLVTEVARLQAELDGALARVSAPAGRGPRRKRPTDRYGRAVHAAGARGKAWHLHRTEYDRLVSQPCSYCGRPTGSGVGLDRLDNARGYELGNVVPCCGACNLLRGNRLTPEETRAAALAILATQGQQGRRDPRAETIHKA